MDPAGPARSRYDGRYWWRLFEGRTPHVGQEAPDNAGAKFAREELEVHDDGAVEAIQALDSVPLLHRQQTFVIRHHVCGADRQRWGRLQWGDGVRPD